MSRDSIRAGRATTFYDGLGEHLDGEGFGDFVRELCSPFHHSGSGGRPPIDPEVYFKMLMVGYFEKLASERGIAARCEDSLAVRRFLHYDLTRRAGDRREPTRRRPQPSRRTARIAAARRGAR